MIDLTTTECHPVQLTIAAAALVYGWGIHQILRGRTGDGRFISASNLAILQHALQERSFPRPKKAADERNRDPVIHSAVVLFVLGFVWRYRSLQREGKYGYRRKGERRILQA